MRHLLRLHCVAWNPSDCDPFAKVERALLAALEPIGAIFRRKQERGSVYVVTVLLDQLVLYLELSRSREVITMMVRNQVRPVGGLEAFPSFTKAIAHKNQHHP